jgi:transcriptional regulator with XRE-family HTH domain/tetratricopeptide (TPR) repeat protein
VPESHPSVSSFGTELRRLRLQAGLTLVELAARTHYSKGYLSKVEHGIKSPSIAFARRCDAILEADGRLIRRVVDGSQRRQVASSPELIGELARNAVDDARTTTPKSPTGDSGVSSAESADEVHPTVESSLSAFRRLLENLRDLGQTLGPSAVMPMLLPQVAALEELSRRVDQSSIAEVLLLAARFAEYTGWMSQELGDDNGALSWTDRAVALAREAGDADLLAYAYVRRANIALYQHDSYGTVVNARRAQAMDCSARVQGLAAQREAQGHALAGDYQAFRRCLDRSVELLASHEDERDDRPQLGPARIRDSVALSEGWGLYDLGRGEEAAEVLTRALDHTSPQAGRARARIGARLALALASIGQIDRACAVVQPILVMFPTMESATIRADLRQLTRTLNRWSNHPSVQRILPELSAALTPTSAHPSSHHNDVFGASPDA